MDMLLLEVPLLCNKIDDTDSLPHVMFSFSTISPLIVDRFERSLRFCHIECDKDAFSDVKWQVLVGVGWFEFEGSLFGHC